MLLKDLHQRQSCPGGAYYVCQNGFRGCCSINPCDPGAVCPDTNTTSGAVNPTRTTSASIRSSTSNSQATPTATNLSTFVSSTASGAMSSSSTRTSSSSAAPIATSLTCPAANGTTYTDPNKVRYSIRCNVDNSYSSFNSTVVGSGGFSKCFSACDDLAACAGFTFVGSDSGDCYLKSDLPADSYTTTAGSNYVTVALIDRNAQVDPPSDALPTEPPASSNTKGPPIGAIVGGVVGGLVAIALLALLVFFCMRRRRRKTEEINSATQKSQASPREAQENESPFAPLGGFYRGKAADTALPKEAPTDTSQLAREDSVNGEIAPKYDRPAPPAVTGPVEMEGKPIYPSATVGPAAVEMDATPVMAPKTPMSPVVDESPILGRYQSNALADRRPTNLADEVRRRQHHRHVMSWNTYDDRHISAISPAGSTNMSPRIGSPDVSPLLNSRGSSKSPPGHSNLGP